MGHIGHTGDKHTIVIANSITSAIASAITSEVTSENGSSATAKPAPAQTTLCLCTMPPVRLTSLSIQEDLAYAIGTIAKDPPSRLRRCRAA